MLLTSGLAEGNGLAVFIAGAILAARR